MPCVKVSAGRCGPGAFRPTTAGSVLLERRDPVEPSREAHSGVVPSRLLLLIGSSPPPHLRRLLRPLSLLQHPSSLPSERLGWRCRPAPMAKFFTLNTGAKIPSVGLGTWQSEPGLVGAAVIAAVKVPFPFRPTLE
ncbi:hypothetical protein BHM03_00025828 [Ensete ventricosum]|nr:hypothetical protein BHM03_00025828 [Ensete ventricosum]